MLLFWLQACLFNNGFSEVLQGVSTDESIELLQIGLHLEGMDKTKYDSGEDMNTHTLEGIELHDPATDHLDESPGLYWLHVPKCGVSFINVFLNDLDLCPKAVAERRCFKEDDFQTQTSAMPLSREMNHGGLCRPGALAPDFTIGHTGIGRYSHGPQRLAMKSRVVVILRQPEQRLISAYYNGPGPHGWWTPPLPRDLREYAEGMQGCAVNVHSEPKMQRDALAVANLAGCCSCQGYAVRCCWICRPHRRMGTFSMLIPCNLWR
jgi:hypothetical protein